MKTSRKILIILIAAILIFLIGLGIFKVIPYIRYGKSIYDLAMVAEEIENKYDENAEDIDMDDLYEYQDAYLNYLDSAFDVAGEDYDVDGLRDELKENAEKEESDKEEKKADNNVSLTFGIGANFYQRDGIVEFYVANPKRSEKDAAIELWVGDYLIAESDRIAPGQELQMLHSKDDLPEELYEILGKEFSHVGIVVVNYYDPETGKKENVNAEIPMNVYFQN